MSPLAKEDDSHRPKKKVSEVSVAAVWAWASPAAMETAWWAATSRKTVPSPPGGRRAAQSQSLRSGSLPRPGPPPLRCPVSRTSTKQSKYSNQEVDVNGHGAYANTYLRRPGGRVVHRGRGASLLVDEQLLPPLPPAAPPFHPAFQVGVSPWWTANAFTLLLPTVICW